MLRRFARSGLSTWQIDKTPRTVSRPGRCLPVSVDQFYSVEGRDIEQVVFAVLLGEEKHRPVFPEFSRPD